MVVNKTDGDGAKLFGVKFVDGISVEGGRIVFKYLGDAGSDGVTHHPFFYGRVGHLNNEQFRKVESNPLLVDGFGGTAVALDDKNSLKSWGFEIIIRKNVGCDFGTTKGMGALDEVVCKTFGGDY